MPVTLAKRCMRFINLRICSRCYLYLVAELLHHETTLHALNELLGFGAQVIANLVGNYLMGNVNADGSVNIFGS